MEVAYWLDGVFLLLLSLLVFPVTTATLFHVFSEQAIVLV